MQHYARELPDRTDARTAGTLAESREIDRCGASDKPVVQRTHYHRGPGGILIDTLAAAAYRALSRSGRLHQTPYAVLKRLGVATPRRRAEFYTLDRLLRTMTIVPGAIAECGTHRGATLLGMAHVLNGRRIRPKIYGLDSFEGFPEPTNEDAMKDGTMHPMVRKGALVASLEELAWRIDNMGLGDHVTLIKGFFQDTLPALSRERFSLVHLDCDLYGSYMTCLEFAYPRMLPDGYMVFDDYNSPAYLGARRAVDEFFADKREQIQFYPEAEGRRFFVRIGGKLAPGAEAQPREPEIERQAA
jgi:hypothetical protein